jgi:hypothetical protein
MGVGMGRQASSFPYNYPPEGQEDTVYFIDNAIIGQMSQRTWGLTICGTDEELRQGPSLAGLLPQIAYHLSVHTIETRGPESSHSCVLLDKNYVTSLSFSFLFYEIIVLNLMTL